MKKKLLLGMILVFSVCLSACSTSQETSSAPSELAKEATTKYTLYVGLDAAATPQDVAEAQKKIDELTIKHQLGLTVFNAYGMYEEDQKVIANPTLVYVILFADDSKVKNLCNDIFADIPGCAILVETQEVNGTLYLEPLK